MFILHKGQRIRFRGLDGTFRARQFAAELTGKCDVEGPVVTILRDCNIGEKELTLRDLGLIKITDGPKDKSLLHTIVRNFRQDAPRAERNGE